MSNLPPYPGAGSPDEPQQPGQQPPPPPAYPQQQPPPPPAYPQQQPWGAQPQQPWGQQPGQQPWGQQPGAASPYGAYAGWNDGGTGQDGWSGVAIAALVFSLTCCLSIVGVILGIIGIFTTGKDKKKGRWMAITAIVVGILMTIAFAVMLVAGGKGIDWLEDQTITPENAEVGDCADIDRDGDEVFLFRLDCSIEHDVQVYAVHELTAQDIADLDSGDLHQLEICGMEAERAFGLEVTSADITVDGHELEIDGVIEDPSNPVAGDTVVCFVEAASGTLDVDLLA